jgi:excisionase family DNA binding protein
MNDPDLMTTQELADWLRISRFSVYHHISHGIPHYRIGPHYRFKREEVEAWMREPAEASRSKPVEHVPASMLPTPQPARAKSDRRQPTMSTDQAIAELKRIMG